MSRYNSTAQVVEVQLGLVCRTVAVSMWPDNWIKLFSTFPQPSQYPQLPTVTLLPSTHKSSRSVPFLSPVGTHSYQQSHRCPPHTNQAVPYLSSAQSVPTVTNSHTAALHTHKTQPKCSAAHCQQPTSKSSNLPPTYLYEKDERETGRKRSK